MPEDILSAIDQPQPVSDAAPTAAIEQAAPGDSAPPAQSAPQTTAVVDPTAPTDGTLLGQDETAVKGEPVETSKDTAKDAKTDPEASDTKTDTTTDAGEPKEGDVAENIPLPTYDAFTAPEGVELDSEVIGDVTRLLGEFEIKTKADHAEIQALAQSLFDRHVAEVQKMAQHLEKSMHDKRVQEAEGWKAQFEKDPDIGGNRKETTVSEALEAIRIFGGNEEQLAELRNVFDTTGAGNHPAVIRLLKNAHDAVAKVRSLPGTRPMPEAQSKVFRRYGTL